MITQIHVLIIGNVRRFEFWRECYLTSDSTKAIVSLGALSIASGAGSEINPLGTNDIIERWVRWVNRT